MALDGPILAEATKKLMGVSNMPGLPLGIWPLYNLRDRLNIVRVLPVFDKWGVRPAGFVGERPNPLRPALASISIVVEESEDEEEEETEGEEEGDEGAVVEDSLTECEASSRVPRKPCPFEISSDEETPRRFFLRTPWGPRRKVPRSAKSLTKR
jgi:hypothetical protein